MPPLRKPRLHFDAEGKLSKSDLDDHVDEVSGRFVAIDAVLTALGLADTLNLATVTRTISRSVAAAGNGGPTPRRRQVVLACQANDPVYLLGFTPDTSQVISASIRGYTMTRGFDFTVSGGQLTVEDHFVTASTEGFLIVEATPA